MDTDPKAEVWARLILRRQLIEEASKRIEKTQELISRSQGLMRSEMGHKADDEPDLRVNMVRSDKRQASK